MSISKDKAEELCSKTEWDTLGNTFPPKVDELKGSVAKKHSNRVRRFLDKEQAEDGAPVDRVKMFEEALERLEPLIPAKAENPKLEARREKEKAAREKAKEVRDHRTEVKEKLIEKAEKEKEKEGGADESNEKTSTGNSVRSRLQSAGKHTQGKIGSRKV